MAISSFSLKNFLAISVVAGGGVSLVGASGYYLADYFAYQENIWIENYFSKMLDAYKSYLTLVSTKSRASSSSESSSSSSTSGSTSKISQEASAAWKKFSDLYNGIFVAGSYSELPIGVKAFGLLKLLSRQRVKAFSAISGDAGGDSTEKTTSSSSKNYQDLGEKILKQINTIHSDFKNIPKSVKDFFKLFVGLLPHSGVTFIGEDIPVPSADLLNLPDEEGTDENKKFDKDKFRKDLFRTLAKGQSILRERNEKEEKDKQTKVTK